MRVFEPLSIACALTVAYVWVTLPELRGFSLQLTAASIVLFFIAKRVSHSRIHHVLPQPETFETALLVGGVALGVGATGGLASPFLPLIYLVLFASVLTLRLSSNIAQMIGLTVFLWAVTPHPLSSALLIELLSLPFLLPLMIFARYQFDEAQEQRHLAQQERVLLRGEEQEIIQFLGTFLHPKLQQLQRTLSLNPREPWVVQKQLELLEKESREFLIRVHEESVLHDTTSSKET